MKKWTWLVLFYLLSNALIACSPTTYDRNTTEVAFVESHQLPSSYRREDWTHWSDFDRDCLDTRQEVLLAYSFERPILSRNGCSVLSGAWLCPYGGKKYTLPSDLDVDHVIPLQWAHVHGGAKWTAQEKELFANDTDNLLLVDDGLNQSKGAKGPDKWMPPNLHFRCTYLATWQSLLEKYGDLKMTTAEARVFSREMKACAHD